MKKIMLPILLLITSNIYAHEEKILSLSDTICKENLCSSKIIDSSNKIKGDFNLSKKVNPFNGVSLYTVETLNINENLNDSTLIVCLKNYQCRLFKSDDGFKADYAYLNGVFFRPERQKRDANKSNNASFKLSADQIYIYDGNEKLNITFPSNK